MLDNEPMGGEQVGTEPAGETAETSTTPPRRARTTRRRSTAAASGEAVASPNVEGDANADVAGEPAAAPTRRRRKATASDKGGDLGVSTQAAPDPVSLDPATAGPAAGPEPSTGAEAAAPPAKATRSRRRKATASDEVAAAPSGVAAPGVVAASAPESDGFGAAAPPAESPAAEPAVTEPAGEGADAPRTRRRRAALSAPTVLFMPPEPAASTAPEITAKAQPAGPADGEEPADTGRRRRRGRRTAEPVDAAPEPVVAEPPVEDDEAEDDDDETEAGRRRRRRGRRGRGRGKGSADEFDDVEEPAAAGRPADASDDAEADADSEADDEDAPLTRRRRRRRRKGDADSGAEDGVPTVVRIREPRRPADEVQGVTGSTRLEAKRQRRRDGREQRRTRPPILSESEFLARREAVDRVMVVRQRGDRTQIAVLEDGVLVEHYVTRASAGTMAGNVYLGKVQNVLPSMEAAFVDIGRGRNAVLYAGEVNWDATGLEGRARSIEQALKSGDSVLVQVTKDPIGHKGARLTSHIALSGRHLVYVPHGNASGISRKLPDTERRRLRDILKKLVPDGAGVIVRTAAEGASEDELARDVKRLQAQWEDIHAKAAEGGAPVLLYEEPDLVIRVVRDLFNEDFRELMIQGDGAYDEVEAYLSHVSPDLLPRLRRHAGVADVFAEKRIDEQILKGLDRKVFLPSGGHLVIDRTEAMTVIDVNTGKYTGAGGNLEETVTRNNLEAAEEIVRQLRLRDLGGIVVIDFIDMVLESNRELVLRRLTECLGRDRTKHQVTEITSLGLVQMTRKRIGAGLLEAFSETCEVCKGRGLIVHTEPVADRAKAGAGEKVKAVASASARSETSGRRRGRASAGAPVVAEDDTMGYDLSRYAEDAGLEDEAVPPAVAGDLADAELPLAADEADDDEDAGIGGATGRRRSRRGGARRRTRP
ncbi:MAG TPA: Rne/Rng family ribonuclease [Pilimelia sp.]|nr:Rne/Rng family ribonuclease [Pilimelia sp.]